MEKTAKKLIELNSKSWLSEKLGISRVTLDTRLSKGNWKKGEIAILIQLDRKLSIA